MTYPSGDRGIRFSDSQRQYADIACTPYNGPPVLFMDEATSALDAQTEQVLNYAIERVSGEKTIVIIVHKEPSLEECDTVVSIKDDSMLLIVPATTPFT